MHLRYWVVIALVALSSAAGADEGTNAWRVEKDRDGIQVSTRAVEGWSVREIRASTRIAGRLSSAVAVLDDVDAMPAVNDVVSEARVLQRDSDTRYRIYLLMKMPWPVSDRDIVNQREITQDAGNLTVTVSDIAVAGAPPPAKGCVRMLKSRQAWTLTPAAGGEVTVELRVLADPAGPIPAAIVNAMAVDGPVKSLSRLRQLVHSPRYADARPAFIREPAGAAAGEGKGS